MNLNQSEILTLLAALRFWYVHLQEIEDMRSQNLIERINQLRAKLNTEAQ